LLKDTATLTPPKKPHQDGEFLKHEKRGGVIKYSRRTDEYSWEK
jgi:hypothetical protein